MRLLATALATLSAVFPATASAYPGERPWVDRQASQELALTTRYWTGQGVAGCVGGTRLLVADSLYDQRDGIDAIERGKDCVVWLSAAQVRQWRSSSRSAPWAWRSALQDECAIVAHGVGHALGLPHSYDGGVMDPRRVAAPQLCRSWALTTVASYVAGEQLREARSDLKPGSKRFDRRG